MRTKTLLLTAAVVAAGISASQAQVYSVNAVGYVNVSLLAGKFYMLANPLNATNNNHINAVLGNVPTDTQLFSWTGTSFAAAEQFIDPVNGWFDGGGNPSTTTLPPGVGFFITSPVDTTITFVGDVAQGNLSNPIPAGYSIRASQVPQSAGLNTLGFPGLVDDVVFFYNPIAGNYTIYTAVDSGPPTLWFDEGGNPVDPTPAVAQAFFVNKGAAASWTRTFTVN